MALIGPKGRKGKAGGRNTEMEGIRRKLNPISMDYPHLLRHLLSSHNYEAKGLEIKSKLGINS